MLQPHLLGKPGCFDGAGTVFASKGVCDLNGWFPILLLAQNFNRRKAGSENPFIGIGSRAANRSE